MSNTIQVHLTVPEVFYAMSLAAQRDAAKVKLAHASSYKSMRDSRISQRITGFGVHFAGVLGELCFRKVHGGRMNTEILVSGDKHAGDVTMPDGRCVEVKASLFQGENVELKFEENELDTIQFCSLVQVAMPDSGKVYPIWSWDEIKPKLIKKNYGYGVRYVFQPHVEVADR